MFFLSEPLHSYVTIGKRYALNHSLTFSYTKKEMADPGATAATRAPHPAKRRDAPSRRATSRAIEKIDGDAKRPPALRFASDDSD